MLSEFDAMMTDVTRSASFAGDIEILYKFAQNRKIKIEIGTMYGISTIILATGGGHVYTIDTHEFYLNDKIKTSIEKHEIVQKWFNLYGNITAIKNDSTDESKNWDDNSIDFIFIDGDHSYDKVKLDFNAWLPKVKKECVILLHDINKLHDGVLAFWNRDMQEYISQGIIVELVQKTQYNSSIRVVKKT